MLTGGEPTLRRDLGLLVARAREMGAEQVTLETNATLLDAVRAHELASAGLHGALVNLSGVGPALDEVTRDPGGAEATLRGVDALLAAGVQVDVQAAVVRSTAGGLAALAPILRARFGAGVRTLFLVVPIDSPDPDELLSFDEAGRVIRETEASARSAGLPLKMAPDSGPPPCVHGSEPRLSHIYSLTPGASGRRDHIHLAPCAQCVVQDRCSGIPRATLERFGAPAMTPIDSDRARRRLSLISTVEEQVARELVTPSRYHDAIYGDVDEDIIRVVFRCNQSCRFCFVSTHLPTAESEAIEDAIRAAAARGRKITLSGGEPTLHGRIVEHVRLAKSLSSLPVLLQTNAVRLADRPLAEALADAGLDEAFVSLHGASAAVSDAVTHAPGTFEKTALGLDHLMQCGVRLQINFVICQSNMHEMAEWVRLLARRWPGAFANVSFVAPSTDVVPRERSLVPRYTDVLPVLAEAVALADDLGVEIGGFESMCGIPLCLVPRRLERYFELSDVPPGFDGGEFTKPPACSSCALASRCYGIRRGYVALHGGDELRPVTAAHADA